MVTFLYFHACSGGHHKDKKYLESADMRMCVSVCVCLHVRTQVYRIRENLAMYKIGFPGWRRIFTQPAL